MEPISKLTGGALAATGAVLAVCAVVAVVLLSSPTASSATPLVQSLANRWRTSTAPASTTTISARQTAIGTILAGPGGETLYAFTRDTRNRDRCASIRGCLAVWPMITTHGSPSAGHGVKRSLLGSITVNGAHQITYAGRPLYRYAQAERPGDTSYVGATQFGASWPAMSPTGHLVH